MGNTLSIGANKVWRRGYLQFEKVLAGLRSEINEEIDDNVTCFSEFQQHRHLISHHAQIWDANQQDPRERGRMGWDGWDVVWTLSRG